MRVDFTLYYKADKGDAAYVFDDDDTQAAIEHLAKRLYGFKEGCVVEVYDILADLASRNKIKNWFEDNYTVLAEFFADRANERFGGWYGD